jgi:transglutaminase-like putative cysteine protease
LSRDLGWVGFDVANAVCPDARYVRVATGRDYVEAAPVKGLTFTAFGDAEPEETLAVELSILQVVRLIGLRLLNRPRP